MADLEEASRFRLSRLLSDARLNLRGRVPDRSSTADHHHARSHSADSIAPTGTRREVSTKTRATEIGLEERETRASSFARGMRRLARRLREAADRLSRDVTTDTGAADTAAFEEDGADDPDSMVIVTI